ncbi:hypothetical protein G7046_g8314 [Stylonectria norvegica]|nr:hypothetical protein G7046_g8314 [Stylonectria norvegica]
MSTTSNPQSTIDRPTAVSQFSGVKTAHVSGGGRARERARRDADEQYRRLSHGLTELESNTLPLDLGLGFSIALRAALDGIVKTLKPTRVDCFPFLGSGGLKLTLALFSRGSDAFLVGIERCRWEKQRYDALAEGAIGYQGRSGRQEMRNSFGTRNLSSPRDPYQRPSDPPSSIAGDGQPVQLFEAQPHLSIQSCGRGIMTTDLSVGMHSVEAGGILRGYTPGSSLLVEDRHELGNLLQPG